MKATLEYEIVDVDYYEHDAMLVIDSVMYYFQWDGKDHPTFQDALNYLLGEKYV